MPGQRGRLGADPAIRTCQTSPLYSWEVVNLAPTALSDKSTRIVVYANGSSSNATIVLQQLAQLGYRDLALYVDGIEGWIEAGLPVN